MEEIKRKVYFGQALNCGINYQDYMIRNEVSERDIIIDDPKDADIIIFSGTCACTEEHVYSSIIYMHDIISQLNDRKKVTVYLTGCMTRPFRINNEFFNKIKCWIDKNIDIVIPQNTPYKLLYYLYPNKDFQEHIHDFGGIILYDNGRANLYISNGCNNRCSFCKTTYQNWPLKSMDIESVKDAIDYANECGFPIKHLEIIGANLSQYGYDLYKEYRLPEIIEYVENKDNIEDIGLGGFSFFDAAKYGFHEVLRDSTKLFSLGGSLESGSNRILRLMGKSVSIEEYIEFVKCIKSKKEKELYLSIIAGFPTETIEDVKMTIDALKQINPSWVDICRYTDSRYIKSHEFEQLSPEQIQEHARIYSKVLTKRRIDSAIRMPRYINNSKIR